MPDLVKLLKRKVKECQIDRITKIRNALDGLGGCRFVGNLDSIKALDQKKRADYIVAFCDRNLVVIESKGKPKNPSEAITQIEQTIEYITRKVIAGELNGVNIVPVFYRKNGGINLKPKERKVKGCTNLLSIITEGKSLKQKLGDALNPP